MPTMPRPLGIALAAALSLTAGFSKAGAAAVGMVDNPCMVSTAPPQAMVDDFKSVYATPPGKPRPAPSPEAIAAQQKMRSLDLTKTDWANLCRYRADDARLAALPANAREVVFMGDSITELWAVAHPGFFTQGRVDRGISGQTTPQMLVRFEADVVALRPRVVHILGGTNDIAGNTGPNSLDELQNNIVAMVTLAKARHIQVILGSVPPAAKFTWAPNLSPAPHVQKINAWLKTYAARTHLIYADYYSAMAAPDGAMRADLTLDGVHPNAAGYAVMEPITRKAIAEALR
ncbi:MAG TPA: GDSL-type esterase/lipase family protein [Caulobacteraceae bacterium]|jgi:lysophospholipase L1-like esterase|nr:GDSL-type esterase/lipase family protein [Caulobacteraceae bacterium]